MQYIGNEVYITSKDVQERFNITKSVANRYLAKWTEEHGRCKKIGRRKYYTCWILGEFIRKFGTKQDNVLYDKEYGKVVVAEYKFTEALLRLKNPVDNLFDEKQLFGNI